MSIPYYRDVEYTDDGCNLSECLSCGKMWEWRGTTYTDVYYCMFCGGRFVCKLDCRPHTTPRWLWEYKKTHTRFQYEKKESNYWANLGAVRKSRKVWVIEERKLFLNSDGSIERVAQDWHRYIPLAWAKTAQEALTALHSERTIQETYPFSFSRDEYRLRLHTY